LYPVGNLRMMLKPSKKIKIESQKVYFYSLDCVLTNVSFLELSDD